MKRKPKWLWQYEDTPGGKCVRQLSANRFHWIEWTDMDDACGQDNEGCPKYNCALSEVDLEVIPESTLQSAIKSCGWDNWEEHYKDNRNLVVSEMLHSYGARAPLWNENGNNLSNLLQQAKRESNELVVDPHLHSERMMQPVNAIGSSALEFMQGDLMSALQRRVKHNNTAAKIMAKAYGCPDEVIKKVAERGPQSSVARVCLNKIPSDDPLAYMNGYMDGLQAAVMGRGEAREDLADAYVEGYKFGTTVRLGEDTAPEWAQQAVGQ